MIFNNKMSFFFHKILYGQLVGDNDDIYTVRCEHLILLFFMCSEKKSVSFHRYVILF